MAGSAAFLEFLREELAPLCDVTTRRMFGIFCDGVMSGLVTENTLSQRVDDENRLTLKETESFPSFSALGPAHRVAANRGRTTPSRTKKTRTA